MAVENRICIVFDDFSKKSKNLSKNEENYCGPTCVVYNPFLFLIPEFQRKSGIVGKYYTTTLPGSTIIPHYSSIYQSPVCQRLKKN